MSSVDEASAARRAKILARAEGRMALVTGAAESLPPLPPSSSAVEIATISELSNDGVTTTTAATATAVTTSVDTTISAVDAAANAAAVRKAKLAARGENAVKPASSSSSTTTPSSPPPPLPSSPSPSIIPDGLRQRGAPLKATPLPPSTPSTATPTSTAAAMKSPAITTTPSSLKAVTTTTSPAPIISAAARMGSLNAELWRQRREKALTLLLRFTPLFLALCLIVLARDCDINWGDFSAAGDRRLAANIRDEVADTTNNDAEFGLGSDSSSSSSLVAPPHTPFLPASVCALAPRILYMPFIMPLFITLRVAAAGGWATCLRSCTLRASGPSGGVAGYLSLGSQALNCWSIYNAVAFDIALFIITLALAGAAAGL